MIRGLKAIEPLQLLASADDQALRDAVPEALRGMVATLPAEVRPEDHHVPVAMRACDHCGASIAAESRYCPVCAALLIDVSHVQA